MNEKTKQIGPTQVRGQSQSQALVRLTNGESSCSVAPAIGGALLSLKLGGFDVLRRATNQTCGVLDTSSFTMVPFSNRIRNGVLDVDGRCIRLPADPAAPPHAHHGHGWRAKWSVLGHAVDRVTLGYHHAADAWPWAYAAEQKIILGAERLDVVLSVVNQSAEPMPVGGGLHPFLPRTPQSALRARSSRMWVNDEDGIADFPVAREIGADHTNIGELLMMDNFFEVEGPVCVEEEAYSLIIEGSNLAGYHVYVPLDANFFCVEPVSHVPGRVTEQPLLLKDESREWEFSIALSARRPQ